MIEFSKHNMILDQQACLFRWSNNTGGSTTAGRQHQYWCLLSIIKVLLVRWRWTWKSPCRLQQRWNAQWWNKKIGNRNFATDCRRTSGETKIGYRWHFGSIHGFKETQFLELWYLIYTIDSIPFEWNCSQTQTIVFFSIKVYSRGSLH